MAWYSFVIIMNNPSINHNCWSHTYVKVNDLKAITYRPALNENGQSSGVESSMISKLLLEERLI